MLQRLLSPLLAAGLALALLAPVSQAQQTAEPRNLQALKQEITAYVATGQYGREVAEVAAQANKYLVKRIPKGIPKRDKVSTKLAVVFDIDETTLSNVRHIQAMDYGYVPKAWDAWVSEGQCTAIYPVQAVYQTALNAKIDVFFITGRRESDAPGTERNLRQVGYESWTRIIYKPAGFTESTKAFKIDARRKLAAEGYLIIANLGDQNSDLAGGYAERVFKLPNPFYLAN
ncbi:MAG: HAD family acid phosphatase [Opitutae bacterium]|nr:HAD family acid phosphatase [Opitutae bacterium]